MPPRTFIFMGRSGSGKGVQVKFLEKWLTDSDSPPRTILHIETGQLLRQFVSTEGLTQRLAAEIMTAGGRTPDFLPIYIWTHELVQRLTGEEHLIFDGTSRSSAEAEALHKALQFYQRLAPVVFYLNVSAEVAALRLANRGRADDEAASNQARQRWFEETVMPVVEYYRANPFYKFVEINGDQPREAVHADIARAL